MLTSSAKALFLLALLMASSLGLIIPVMIKIALILGELSRRAIEENITEKIIDRTIDYVRDVSLILSEWLSINTTSIGEHNTTNIDINKSSSNELMETTNKTKEDFTVKNSIDSKHASTTVTKKNAVPSNYVKYYRRTLKYLGKTLTIKFSAQ